ncbi:MAG: diguanylate cyclase, partial [Candidatus Coatesbacteria bacterium]|nr:diguanylate cyclase [Candidatus Coatesbacteria bacterium]
VRDSVDVVARYGGEEFAIILLETKKASARIVAERVRDQVAKCPLLYYVESDGKRKVVSRDVEGARPLHTTICVGISSFPTDAKSPERLIDLADEALYLGKAAGGNKVVLVGETCD